MSPSYLKNELPRLRRTLCRQSNSTTLHELKCKSLWYMSSLFPNTITSWNNVITHFDDIPSFNVLRKHILSCDSPKEESSDVLRVINNETRINDININEIQKSHRLALERYKISEQCELKTDHS